MKFTEEQARDHTAKNSRPSLAPPARNYWCPACFDRKKPVNRTGTRQVNGVWYCETCAVSAPAALETPPEASIPANAARVPVDTVPLARIPGRDSGKAVSAKPRRASEPNRTEREYEMMLKASFPAAVIKWEAYTLRLASRCTYTPDFSVLHPSGELEFFEVKGAYVFPKALVKLRMAAEQFDHPFTLAQKLKSGWEISSIPGRRK